MFGIVLDSSRGEKKNIYNIPQLFKICTVITEFTSWLLAILNLNFWCNRSFCCFWYGLFNLFCFFRLFWSGFKESGTLNFWFFLIEKKKQKPHSHFLTWLTLMQIQKWKREKNVTPTANFTLRQYIYESHTNWIIKIFF